MVLTLAELVQSAGAWGITSTLPPAAHRGAYVGAFRLGGQLQYLVAPAGLTALGVTTGGWGWFPLVALFAIAAVAAAPLVAWAARRPRLGETVETVEPVAVPG